MPPQLLCALPTELARLVKAFLTLDDVIVLCGSTLPSVNLDQFLPDEQELDAYVPTSVLRLRSDARRRSPRTQCAVLPSLRRQRCSLEAPQPSCPYHNESLRLLLIHCDSCAATARRSLDATEALQHLQDDKSAVNCERVAIEILESHRRRRQLNRIALTRTLALALRRSYHAVVKWALQELKDHISKRWRLEVLLACCEYDDPDGSVALELVQALDVVVPSDYESIVAAAARHGRLTIVQQLLTKTNPLQLENTTGLRAAAEGGYIEIVRLFVVAAPASQDGTEALCCACQNNHRTVVDELLASPLHISRSPVHSPLYAAVIGGDVDIVSRILANARVNSWDPLAFHRAACDGKIAIVNKLLCHPDCRHKDIDIALRAAARNQQHADKTDVTLVLCELIHRLDDENDVALSWELVDLACAYGNATVLDLVLARLAQRHWSDRRHWRPLVTVARYGHAHLARQILDTDTKWLPGQNPNDDDDTEVAEALLAACHRDHLSTAQLLLPYVSNDLMRLLRIGEAAAAAPTCSVLQFLLATQESITIECDLDAALQYACANGRIAAASLLLNHPGVQFSEGVSIQFAATSGNVALVNLLLSDSRVNVSYDLEAALVDASREGHTDVVARLLDDPRLHVTCGSAFHEAAHRGHIGVMTLLLRADVMWRAPELLHLEASFTGASRRGHYDIIFLLLNDTRVSLPNRGVISRIEELPRRPGDPTWCRFLRRFFRHPRIDPSGSDDLLLLQACQQARHGIVDSLLRSGRVNTTELIRRSVEENTRRAALQKQPQLLRRYRAIYVDLLKYTEKSTRVSH